MVYHCIGSGSTSRPHWGLFKNALIWFKCGCFGFTKMMWCDLFSCSILKLLDSGETCLHQWAEWSLVHVMTCLLFGAKPLPEPVWPIVSWIRTNFNEMFMKYVSGNVFVMLSAKCRSFRFAPKMVVHGSCHIHTDFHHRKCVHFGRKSNKKYCGYLVTVIQY